MPSAWRLKQQRRSPDHFMTGPLLADLVKIRAPVRQNVLIDGNILI